MSTSSPVICVSDFEVDVVREDIKNLRLAVYPPFGRVRVAAPSQLDDDAIRLAVIARLSWVTKQRKQMRDQLRQTHRDIVNGETHYLGGRPHRLRVINDGARPHFNITTPGRLELHVPDGADRDARACRLEAWYRRQLNDSLPELKSKWAPVLRIDAPSWGTRRMKTRCGTCNAERRHIWLNLELAQKNPVCLEYIAVHEMVHLLERNHTHWFYDLMATFKPNWTIHREELNRSPLGHQEWLI
ncbi:MAG: M48 family metallopeptidase [Mycobacteriales bacterium]